MDQNFFSVLLPKMVFGILREQDNMPPPPPAGQCFVMAFPLKYGLPPVCVEGQTADSPAHVKAAFAHMKKVAAERKMFQFQANGATALAARWHARVYGE
mmetsp:Transcript_7407/g.22618  ORF Transcript_7407/g.22618 Transcript_7407/m.22618 type:complete len:99 (+) Transcript_7407:40-336(+)